MSNQTAVASCHWPLFGHSVLREKTWWNFWWKVLWKINLLKPRKTQYPVTLRSYLAVLGRAGKDNVQAENGWVQKASSVSRPHTPQEQQISKPLANTLSVSTVWRMEKPLMQIYYSTFALTSAFAEFIIWTKCFWTKSKKVTLFGLKEKNSSKIFNGLKIFLQTLILMEHERSSWTNKNKPQADCSLFLQPLLECCCLEILLCPCPRGCLQGTAPVFAFSRNGCDRTQSTMNSLTFAKWATITYPLEYENEG